MSPRISYAVARPFVKRIAGYAYSFMRVFRRVQSSSRQTERKRGGGGGRWVATLNRYEWSSIQYSRVIERNDNRYRRKGLLVQKWSVRIIARYRIIGFVP